MVSCTKGKQGLSPGLSDESINFVMVEVDGDAPENKDPKQSLDDGEIIEVCVVFWFLMSLRTYVQSKMYMSVIYVNQKCILCP